MSNEIWNLLEELNFTHSWAGIVMEMVGISGICYGGLFHLMAGEHPGDLLKLWWFIFDECFDDRGCKIWKWGIYEKLKIEGKQSWNLSGTP